VASGAGGGTGLFARTVQAAITRHNLASTSVVVSNKCAGSGTEGSVHGRGAKSEPRKVIFPASGLRRARRRRPAARVAPEA
jgi:tripartite-type tricarboxylate transporter receptor subunit TctC